MTIERLARALLARLPHPLSGDAAEDLLDDHRRLRESHGGVAATLFLVREGGLLAVTLIAATAARLLRSLAVLRRDAAHALRAIARRPWASAGAIVMLAAGLAAVASASGLATTLLMRPISGRYPGEVVRLAASDRAGAIRMAFSAVELEQVLDAAAGAANIAMANLQPVVLRIGETSMQSLAEAVGGRYFDILGLDVVAGRPLMEGDAAAAAAPVMVISDALWRDHFGRSPDAIGSAIRLNGRAFTIAGVAARASTSTFLGGSVDSWIALAHADAMLDRDWRTNPDERWWTTLLHPKPAVGRAQIDAILERATTGLAARWPEAWRDRRLVTVPGTLMTGRQRTGAMTLSIVLIAFATLILAASAANVSGLLLAAAAADRGRAAIQLALGSGRAAIMRRHLIEGALVGAAGGVVALGIYAAVRRQLIEVTLLPTLSLRLDLPMDAGAAAGTIGAGAVAGLLLALGPALWITRLDVAPTLRDGAGRGSSAGLSRARRILVAAQVAISITLLSGASLFARSVDSLATLDVGFPRRGLIALDFDLEPSAPSREMLPGLAREALLRTAAVPGVVAAAMSNRAPIDSSTPTVAVNIAGSSAPPLEGVTFYLATEDYFDTVGLPLLRGRGFSAAEVAREDDVCIVNETLGRRLWPAGDAIDRAIVLQPEGRTMRVVGIARDSKYRSLSEEPRPHLYLPTAPSFSQALLVRTNDDPQKTILAVQSALDQVGPGVVGFFPRTLDDHLAIDTLTTRAAAAAAGVLAALALVLSTAGLYGIVMWFVEVRRREIGVRVALGASAGDVRRLIVGQAVIAAAPGVVVGSLLAVSLTVFGRSLFVGVAAIDPASLALGVMVLGVIVLTASYLPSRRATQVDPVTVLKDS